MRVQRRHGGLLRRVAAGTGVEEVLGLERRVAGLAEAMAENAVLEELLAVRLAELERALLPRLEQHQRQAREKQV